MVSKITDRILSVVSEWQNRPLEQVYSFIFLDAIHYKVRDEKQIVNKAVYALSKASKLYHSSNTCEYEICCFWRSKSFCKGFKFYLVIYCKAKHSKWFKTAPLTKRM